MSEKQLATSKWELVPPGRIRKTMKQAEWVELREQLGLSVDELAIAMRISRSVAFRLDNGHQTVPEPYAMLLRMFVKHGIPKDR